MTRVRMSRPTSSVPNQCAADGGLRTSAQLVAMRIVGRDQRREQGEQRERVDDDARPTHRAVRRRSSRRSARRLGLSSVVAIGRQRVAMAAVAVGHR